MLRKVPPQYQMVVVRAVTVKKYPAHGTKLCVLFIKTRVPQTCLKTSKLWDEKIKEVRD